MTQTVLITGASTGIGHATARHFQAQGWNVIATMRTPENGADLAILDNVLVTRLDVTDETSITQAVTEGHARFGRIDALINNAGYGAFGPLEAFDMERIRRQFDTNVIGLLAVTKAVLPHMRARKSGTIVNISSIAGRMTFPVGALYHGSKFAVEGLSEALHYELESIGIAMKIIEPGMVHTDFGGRSIDFANDESLSEYQPVFDAFNRAFAAAAEQGGVSAEHVAGIIYGATTDGTKQLRYTAGDDAAAFMADRSAQDDETFIGGLKASLGL